MKAPWLTRPRGVATRMARRFVRVVRPGEIDVPLATVKEVVARHGVQPWFVYAFEEWEERPEPRAICHWLGERLAPQAKILEAGCGMATNLIWFSQHGFSDVFGFDSDARAIDAAREVCTLASANVRLWVDDGIRPAHLPGRSYDAIIVMGWVFLLDGFDLLAFLRTYEPALADGGYLALDLIDKAYDQVPDNQYLTSDWTKPPGERRPTEYRKRHSRCDVEEAAAAAGLRVVDALSQPQVVPRTVYVLTRA